MRNTKYLFIACFLLCTLQVFSQEDLQESVKNEQSENIQTVVVDEQKTASLQINSGAETGVKLDLSPFLLKSSLREKGFYHTSDGMPIKYGQVRKTVSVAYGNETLLKQEKRWRVAARTLMGVFFTSNAVLCVSSFADDDTFNKIDAINDPVFEISLFSWILTGIVANVKLQKAVDNYNYYITRPER